MQGAGYACGQNYQCMENSRERLGTMSPYYDNNSYGSRNSDSYQPYPSVSPRIEPLDNYGNRQEGIQSHRDGRWCASTTVLLTVGLASFFQANGAFSIIRPDWEDHGKTWA
jgi:hypothetical protein